MRLDAGVSCLLPQLDFLPQSLLLFSSLLFTSSSVTSIKLACATVPVHPQWALPSPLQQAEKRHWQDTKSRIIVSRTGRPD